MSNERLHKYAVDYMDAVRLGAEAALISLAWPCAWHVGQGRGVGDLAPDCVDCCENDAQAKEDAARIAATVTLPVTEREGDDTLDILEGMVWNFAYHCGPKDDCIHDGGLSALEAAIPRLVAAGRLESYKGRPEMEWYCHPDTNRALTPKTESE